MPYKDPEARKAMYKRREQNPERKKYRTERDAQQRKEARISRPFVAVDGEGITLENGEHIYTMLCASTGDYVLAKKPEGLDFFECVRFLLQLKSAHPDCIMVGYGFNYDVNMMLKSQGLQWVNDTLFNPPADFNGYTRFDELGGYLYVDWKPRKTFTLKLKGKGKELPGLIIYDVLGFFQAPFYRALVENGIGEPETLEKIERMKRARSTFQQENQQEVLEYSLLECRLLVELMNKLRDMIVGLEDTEIKLRLPLNRWDGAGAIAAELMKFYKVKEHRYPEDRPNMIVKGGANVLAYYGGRFESPMLGMIRRTFSYDINSAYPAAMVSLPCLKNARYLRIDDQWNRKDLALCHVEWDLPGDTIIAPFPFRDRHGRISFPVNGTGWYWSHEVIPAIERFGERSPSGSPGIRLIDVFVLKTDGGDCSCGGQPFSWIPELYEFRRKLKNEGDARQMPLKLGYNSCYGKLAQGVGVAPFQDFVWAGLITSFTRGMILRAIYGTQSEKYVVSIATDGIEFTRKIKGFDVGDGLGQWEHSIEHDVFIAGNGLMNYQCGKCEGVGGTPEDPCKKCVGRGYIQKVRGFSKGERINWTLLREAFLQKGMGANIKVDLNRFIGASLATHLTDEHKWMWCRWLTQAKNFTVQLKNRKAKLSWGSVGMEAGGRIPVRKKGTVWLTDPIGASERESYPHRPKTYRGTLESPEDLALLVDTELSSD